MEPLRIGIIGTGNISPAYIKGCRDFDILHLAACADLDLDKARAVAAENEIPAVYSVEDMLNAPDIDIVVNLTIPAAHAAVSLSALNAGKHVYSEKPFAVTRDDGQKILATAREKGLRVGCAPDTFLFGPHQTCRKLIDEGAIGRPVAAFANMLSHGPESWHPNPDFFYQTGGGPMFDMGPYYVTCLVNLLGAVESVTAVTRKSFDERIMGKNRDGRHIPVEIPTHYTGALDFEGGAVATVTMSFDIWGHSLPRMEIYGSEGSLYVPDPNGYEKTVKLWRDGKWEEIPLTHREEWRRGIGLADMAYAITNGREQRASGDLAYHVLDVMHCFEESSNAGQRIEVGSRAERPAALPVGLEARVLDA
jgi:predicted dehydrogenase